MKKFIQFIGGLLFLVIMVIIVWCFLEMIAPLDAKVIDPGYKNRSVEELKSSMRYHGILIAKQDENHAWYFMRDGKRCSLFAYLERK
ncbi:MAG: hypothetical protein KKE05_03525 [Nanoarchaeota archaeon]|nr:hypothetical protein [Nanoarchaeota archaeon]